MSQKINLRERRYNGVDYDTLHPETNINMVLDSSNNSVGGINGALYGDGNGNIVGATISNPNLLDNSWFTINQRGFTTGQSPDYTVDRWKIYNAKLTVNSDKTVTVQGLADGALLNQALPRNENENLIGKTITISLLDSNGNLYSYTGVCPSSGALVMPWSGNLRLYLYVTNNYIAFEVEIRNNDTFTFQAAKFELGSVSTLANDVAPNYELELLKCQSSLYMIKAKEAYARIGLGYAGPATVLVVINLSIPLKSNTPTPTLSGTVTLTGGGVTTTATAVNCLYRTANQLTLAFTTATTIPVGSCCDVFLNAANDYISVSAEQ